MTKISKIEFDRVTRKSTAVIQSKGKTYVGTSTLHPLDYSNVSPYFGCHIATIKAYREMYLAKERELMEKAEMLERLAANCRQTTNFDASENSYRVILNNIKGYRKQARKWQDKAHFATEAIMTHIVNRTESLKKHSAKEIDENGYNCK